MKKIDLRKSIILLVLGVILIVLPFSVGNYMRYFCCLLGIILSQQTDTRLHIRMEQSPRLAIQIVEEASGAEEVAYNFITADMKYIITADGKIFYVKDGL